MDHSEIHTLMNQISGLDEQTEREKVNLEQKEKIQQQKSEELEQVTSHLIVQERKVGVLMAQLDHHEAELLSHQQIYAAKLESISKNQFENQAIQKKISTTQQKIQHFEGKLNFLIQVIQDYRKNQSHYFSNRVKELFTECEDLSFLIGEQ